MPVSRCRSHGQETGDGRGRDVVEAVRRVARAAVGRARDVPDSGEVTPGWTPARFGDENRQVFVGDVELWSAAWEPTGQHIVVAHPQYPQQRHSLTVYRVAATPPVVFASGEVSNTAFVFSVPVGEERAFRVV